MSTALCQRILAAVPSRLVKGYSVSVMERADCARMDLRLVPNPYKEGHALMSKSYDHEFVAKAPKDRLQNIVAADVAEMVVLLDAANAGKVP